MLPKRAIDANGVLEPDRNGNGTRIITAYLYVFRTMKRRTLVSKRFLFSVLFFAFTAYCAEQKIITIPSAVMKKEFKATVILPDSYTRSQKRYSVIYLLHGFGGDHTVWPHIAPLKQCSDSLKLIFVCPDGDNSWYRQPGQKRINVRDVCDL